MQTLARKDRALPDAEAEACRQLWCAVIAEAWRIVVGQGSMVTPLEFSKAEAFFESNRLDDICALAGLDAGWIRRGFQEFKAGKEAGRVREMPRMIMGKRRWENS